MTESLLQPSHNTPRGVRGQNINKQQFDALFGRKTESLEEPVQDAPSRVPPQDPWDVI